MLLLDTQAIIWFAQGNDEFGNRAHKEIEQASALCYSTASVLEMQIKRMLGKLKVSEAFVSGLPDYGFHELPMTTSDAVGIADFKTLLRHDPFDRVILSTAVGRGIKLLTSDSVLLSLGISNVIDARK
jgi:PIN domain nuclease of toxin-antitoxin system